MADFDVFSPTFRADPYPVYAMFRRDDPIHPGRPPTPGTDQSRWWYLFRYVDIAVVLSDDRFGRSILPALDAPPQPVPTEEREPFWDMYGQWTLALEPPDHTRQRKLLSPAFTARAVGVLRPFIEQQAATLLDQLAQRPQFDVVADYAFPLTLSVIARLIGLPQENLAQVKEWSLTIADVLDYKRSWDVMERGNRMTADFTAYLNEIVAMRRTVPEDDLITRLLPTADAGTKLSVEELVSLCVMLLFAGHETTVNLISAGTLLLLESPDQRDLLMQQPALIDSAVDEILRFHSPIQATSRNAYADAELDGLTIQRGDSVMLMLGSANRDSAVFEEPDRLAISRRPNRHLAFGRGIHYCLGAPLAVAQGGFALLALLQRFPDLRLLDQTPQWSDTFGFRGLVDLNVQHR